MPEVRYSSKRRAVMAKPAKSQIRSAGAFLAPRVTSSQLAENQAGKTVSAANTGPSTQTRFIAGPSGVRT